MATVGGVLPRAELDEALERQAAQEGVSKAELLRSVARERFLSGPLEPSDPVWQLCGSAIGADLVDDEYAGCVSEHVDEILYDRSGSQG